MLQWEGAEGGLHIVNNMPQCNLYWSRWVITRACVSDETLSSSSGLPEKQGLRAALPRANRPAWKNKALMLSWSKWHPSHGEQGRRKARWPDRVVVTKVHSLISFLGQGWYNLALNMQVTGGQYYKYGTSKCQLHSHFKQICPSTLFLLCRKNNNLLNFLLEPYFSILIIDPTHALNTLSIKVMP